MSPILIITPIKLSLAKAVQAQYYLEEDRLAIPEKRFLSTTRASISVCLRPNGNATSPSTIMAISPLIIAFHLYNHISVSNTA